VIPESTAAPYTPFELVTVLASYVAGAFGIHRNIVFVSLHLQMKVDGGCSCQRFIAHQSDHSTADRNATVNYFCDPNACHWFSGAARAPGKGTAFSSLSAVRPKSQLLHDEHPTPPRLPQQERPSERCEANAHEPFGNAYGWRRRHVG
jgi:hypothetical protein